MKNAIAIGLLGVAHLAFAFLYPRFSIPFLWAAASFGLIGLAYGGYGVRIFQKSPNGRIPWFQKFVLLPYLLLTWSIWHLYRLLSKEDAFNQFDENLVIGRRLLDSEIPERFDHYVDLTAEFEAPSAIRSQDCYRSFPILDASIPPENDLEVMLEVIKEGRTYVHCAQGHGRTGLFALALLAHRGQIDTVSQGLKLLRKVRPAVSLNQEQYLFIRQYLNKKRKRGTNPASPPCHLDFIVTRKLG